METPELSDRTWVDKQYADASKLCARRRLHTLYSTNKRGWHRWVFDQLDGPDRCRLLELGGGTGALWERNLKRLPPEWSIVVSDLSSGMLHQAVRALSKGRSAYAYARVDAQVIPFANQELDAVIANHMLYHVPNVCQALGEIRRVLRSRGRLYAATNGRAHMAELGDLVRRFDPRLPHLVEELGFSLDNGAAQLSPHFRSVEVRRYQDSLRVTDVEPLVDYVFSAIDARPEVHAAFAQFVERELDSLGGAMHIGKDTGLFVACPRE